MDWYDNGVKIDWDKARIGALEKDNVSSLG